MACNPPVTPADPVYYPLVPRFTHTFLGEQYKRFDASTSSYGPGDVFTWDFGDGTTGTGMIVDHQFPPGLHLRCTPPRPEEVAFRSFRLRQENYPATGAPIFTNDRYLVVLTITRGALALSTEQRVKDRNASGAINGALSPYGDYYSGTPGPQGGVTFSSWVLNGSHATIFSFDDRGGGAAGAGGVVYPYYWTLVISVTDFGNTITGSITATQTG